MATEYNSLNKWVLSTFLPSGVNLCDAKSYYEMMDTQNETVLMFAFLFVLCLFLVFLYRLIDYCVVSIVGSPTNDGDMENDDMPILLL